MTDILQAARSYYGLADTECCTTQLFTNQDGQTCVAFEIAMSNEDFAAILQRMQNMQQPDTQPDTAIIEGPTVEAMREAYNALSSKERGKYKSFARYVAECSTGIIDVYTGEPYEKTIKPHAEGSRGKWDLMSDEDKKEFGTFDRYVEYSAYESMSNRQVVQVDAPEEPEPVSMDAVWLHYHDCTHEQRMHNDTDYDDQAGYKVPWAMLTDEQKKKAKEKP